jgi:hypothetical protein
MVVRTRIGNGLALPSHCGLLRVAWNATPREAGSNAGPDPSGLMRRSPNWTARHRVGGEVHPLLALSVARHDAAIAFAHRVVNEVEDVLGFVVGHMLLKRVVRK